MRLLTDVLLIAITRSIEEVICSAIWTKWHEGSRDDGDVWKETVSLFSIPIVWLYYCDYYFHYILNWRLTALQCFVSFCCTATWISYKYLYIPSLLSLPSTSPSHPFCHHRALSWAPCVIQELPITYLFYTW